MRHPVKKLLIGGLGILAFLAAIVLALPGIISSDSVRASLMERAREITGREMRFSGDPKILFQPFLGIEINDVVFADSISDDGTAAILEMPKLIGEISLSSLLRGNVQVNDFRFIRPRFHLNILPDGRTNWSFPEGRVWSTLEEARTLRDETPTGSEPDLSRLAKVDLGSFEVSDGIINYRNGQTQREETITNFNGKLVWPDTRASWQFRGNGIWRGDVFTVENSINRPVMLMAGGSSPMRLKIASEPINMDFSGEANRFSSFYISGQLNASSPSLRRLVNLAGGEAGSGSSFASFATDGRVSGTLSQLQLDDAAFSLDGNRSTGNLRISLSDQGNLRITGTLASSLTRLDPYLTGWRLSDMVEDSVPGMPILSKTEFDIRLSSALMTLGNHELTEFAGAFVTRDGRMIIDIGNASIAKGTVIGQIEAGSSPEGAMVGADLALRGVDLSQFDALMKQFAVRPSGVSDVLLKFKTTGKKVSELVANAEGEFALTMANGNLFGMDFGQLTRGIEKPAESSENIQIASGSDQTSVQNLKIKAMINRGVAWIRESGFATKTHTTRLDGKADLRSGNLALWGRLARQEPTEEDPKQFFIGGTLSGPLFVPEVLTGN